MRMIGMLGLGAALGVLLWSAQGSAAKPAGQAAKGPAQAGRTVICTTPSGGDTTVYIERGAAFEARLSSGQVATGALADSGSDTCYREGNTPGKIGLGQTCIAKGKANGKVWRTQMAGITKDCVVVSGGDIPAAPQPAPAGG